MKTLKKSLFIVFSLAVLIYLGLCLWFYTSQEKALFNSAKLPIDHRFQFDSAFEERFITMTDNTKLHGVMFKATEPKGLILWLPGGKGMIDSIGVNAHYYTDLGYDLFIVNFRGFGKSEGKISGEAQFNQDMQTLYDQFKQEYGEEKIIVFGYSLGTGPAAALAARNHPHMLILKAPYYSMTELTQKAMPYLPIGILQKYRFCTYQYLKDVQCPVAIVHGDSDRKIPVSVSYRLKGHLKPTDKLIIIKGQGHNGFVNNPEYLSELKNLIK